MAKRTAQNDPLFKKAQAAAIVTRRIQGDSLDTIASNFNISRDTVERRLKYAKRSGLLESAADKMLSELVPLAHGAYAQALMHGEIADALAAARDIFYGTGILSKNNKAQVAPAEQVEMTLAVYREQRKKAYIAPGDETSDDRAAVSGTPGLDAAADGEILGEDDGEDGLSPERPDSWPDPEPDPDALDLDEEDS